jgi:hypothetical protein
MSNYRPIFRHVTNEQSVDQFGQALVDACMQELRSRTWTYRSGAWVGGNRIVAKARQSFWPDGAIVCNGRPLASIQIQVLVEEWNEPAGLWRTHRARPLPQAACHDL